MPKNQELTCVRNKQATAFQEFTDVNITVQTKERSNTAAYRSNSHARLGEKQKIFISQKHIRYIYIVYACVFFLLLLSIAGVAVSINCVLAVVTAAAVADTAAAATVPIATRSLLTLEKETQNSLMYAYGA